LLRFPEAGAPDQPRRRRLIRRSDTLMPTDRLDPIVNGFRSAHRSEWTPPRPAWFVLRLEEFRVLWACRGNCVSGRTMIATCANQPATNFSAIFALERSSCLMQTIWALDREPIIQKRRIEYFWLCGECAPAMLLMRTTDGAVTICESSRSSDPLGPPRITFAREVIWLKAPKV
jgi:hypothetical protein